MKKILVIILCCFLVPIVLFIGTAMVAGIIQGISGVDSATEEIYETIDNIMDTIPTEEILITEIETDEITEIVIIQTRPVETTTSTSTEPTENIPTTTPPNEEVPTEEETTAAPTTAPQKQEIYVYITQTGSKYHSSKNCRHIKDSVGVVSYLLEVAINMGYTACKTCY